MMEKNCEATTTLQKTQSNIMERLQKLEDRMKKEQNDAVASPDFNIHNLNLTIGHHTTPKVFENDYLDRKRGGRTTMSKDFSGVYRSA